MAFKSIGAGARFPHPGAKDIYGTFELPGDVEHLLFAFGAARPADDVGLSVAFNPVVQFGEIRVQR